MRGGVLIVCLLAFFQEACSQCCSAGTPVSGSTNVGIVGARVLRVNTFYRYGRSAGYWEGDRRSDFEFVSSASYSFVGAVLTYGITGRLNVETELGYYLNKTQTYNIPGAEPLVGSGLSNAFASLKWNAVQDKSFLDEWTLSAGAKFPFGSAYQVVNNVELPRDVQPSTHAFGALLGSFLRKDLGNPGLRLFLVNRFEMNSPDMRDYKFGSALYSSFFMSKRFGTGHLTGTLQLRHEYRTRDVRNATGSGLFATGETIASTGGQLLFLAPQITYTIQEKWNISLITELPVYRRYNGVQLGTQMGAGIFVSRDLGGKCKVPAPTTL